MIDQRIGNDIKVDWYITRKDGQAFSLEGLDVSLYLKSMFGRKPLSDFVITGNIIQWTFYGKDQKSVGAYSLEMVVNEGEKGMITTDACDFVNLVSCTCQLEGGKDEDGVETESIELTSTLEYVSGGGETVNSPILRSKGTSSAIQEVEAETFTDKNENSSTYGQEVKAEASGDYSLALGGDAAATAKRAVAQGHRCIVRGETSHAEGHCAVVEYIDETLNGYGAHAEGYSTIVAGPYSHVEGSKCVVIGSNSHAEGGETGVAADMAHSEGYKTRVEAGADGAHAEGNSTEVHAKYSHVEGRLTKTYGEGAHAEGTETEAHKDYSHTEGNATKSKGLYAHAEGIRTETNAAGAHAEGFETYANNECSHSEGHGAVASGIYAHAEGWVANAIGEAAHAEGQNTRAHQIGSHSEGNNTDAKGPYSHAEGIGTKTKEGIAGQHVEGYYNQESDSVKIIGCGTSDTDRKNAVEVTQDGRMFVKGVGNYDGTSLEAKDLATVINEGGQGGGGDLSDYLPREEFNEVSEGFALADDLTELSERVDALREGGSDVFSAEYGVTTYNEILEAYNAGKVVICTYNNVIYRLVYAVNIMHFVANVNKTLMYVRCPQSNNWQQSTENTEHKLETLDNGNAKITIAGQSAEVATPQYVDEIVAQLVARIEQLEAQLAENVA